MKQFIQLLQTELPKDTIFENELMKNYTTFKIGGVADVVLKPKSYEEVSKAVKLCRSHQIPFYILGNGSNLLVSDEGYRGVIIQIYNQLADVEVDGNQITAKAGALLSRIATKAMENGLTGLEFAHGIPGTLGGAVVMNAGAYGGEMKDVLVSCDILDAEGNLLTLTKEELELGYRSSVIAKKNYVVLGATMALKEGDQESIKSEMKELMGRRRDKQPLEKPSAGSTFKRPVGHFAGKLIMDAGLRGYQIGGARVSDKHCGFVVNEGGATCKDVEDLIAHVQKVIKEQFNVTLEAEVKILK